MVGMPIDSSQRVSAWVESTPCEYHTAIRAEGQRGSACGPGLQRNGEMLFLTSIRVLKNKHQTVSQGVRRFGKRSLFSDGCAFKKAAQRRITT
jgi:hypothetical protein